MVNGRGLQWENRRARLGVVDIVQALRPIYTAIRRIRQRCTSRTYSASSKQLTSSRRCDPIHNAEWSVTAWSTA
jgi:hypothetical protein